MKNILKDKRGVSPIIATVGLVGISIALFVIIFLWSRGFVAEQVMKFDQPVEEYCQNVDWEVYIDTNKNMITINNIGNVNLWKIMVVSYSDGSKKINFYSASGQDNIALPAGSYANFSIQDLSNANKIEIYPVLLGEGQKSGKALEYPCKNIKETFYF